MPFPLFFWNSFFNYHLTPLLNLLAVFSLWGIFQPSLLSCSGPLSLFENPYFIFRSRELSVKVPICLIWSTIPPWVIIHHFGGGGLFNMWSNIHPVHHSQDLGKSPGVLWSFSYEPWTNHIPVQNLRNQKIKVWTYPNIYVYKIYIPSEHIFWTCSPLFLVIENMGHLGMIWWHLRWGPPV